MNPKLTKAICIICHQPMQARNKRKLYCSGECKRINALMRKNRARAKDCKYSQRCTVPCSDIKFCPIYEPRDRGAVNITKYPTIFVKKSNVFTPRVSKKIKFNLGLINSLANIFGGTVSLTDLISLTQKTKSPTGR